jgi:hypothetical protein
MSRSDSESASLFRRKKLWKFVNITFAPFDAHETLAMSSTYKHVRMSCFLNRGTICKKVFCPQW